MKKKEDISCPIRCPNCQADFDFEAIITKITEDITREIGRVAEERIRNEW